MSLRTPGTGWLVGLLAAAKKPSARAASPATKAKKRRNATSGWVERPRAANILVIDDEPQVAAGLKRTLRRHRVTLANSGEEAKRLVGEHNFDVIISDVMMPDFSGLDLYLELRSQQSPLPARFIFVTGGVHGSKAQRFLASVPNQRLDKPVDALELEHAIARILNGPEAGSADSAG
ncbi:MAG TPA: response regulator [Polyangiales bacterium]